MVIYHLTELNLDRQNPHFGHRKLGNFITRNPNHVHTEDHMIVCLDVWFMPRVVQIWLMSKANLKSLAKIFVTKRTIRKCFHQHICQSVAQTRFTLKYDSKSTLNRGGKTAWKVQTENSNRAQPWCRPSRPVKREIAHCELHLRKDRRKSDVLKWQVGSAMIYFHVQFTGESREMFFNLWCT